MITTRYSQNCRGQYWEKVLFAKLHKLKRRDRTWLIFKKVIGRTVKTRWCEVCIQRFEELMTLKTFRGIQSFQWQIDYLLSCWKLEDFTAVVTVQKASSYKQLLVSLAKRLLVVQTHVRCSHLTLGNKKIRGKLFLKNYFTADLKCWGG